MAKYELPALPYSYDALEPHIDALTVEIHHDRHQATYLNNLNKALEGHEEVAKGKSIADLLSNLNDVPESIRTAVKNHGGGVYNHTLYWNTLGPNSGGQPTGELADAINGAFGSFENFKEKLTQASVGRFGSGWGWLVVDGKGNLEVINTLNQDCPLSEGKTPILCCDVWEHAYYLKYQNKRPDYVNNWWNVINWNEVSRLYKEAK